MKRLILLFFSFILPISLIAQINFDCTELKQKIKDTCKRIDSLMEGEHYPDYGDTIDSLNTSLYGYLASLVENDRFQKCDVNLKYDFYSLLSSDKKFCITSWDTRQGGTMIDYTNTVIYKAAKNTSIKTLKYGDGELHGNTQILFDTLITLYNIKGEPIYIASGFGQSSTALPYRVLKAFMVTDSLVEDFKLFPDSKVNFGFSMICSILNMETHCFILS